MVLAVIVILAAGIPAGVVSLDVIWYNNYLGTIFPALLYFIQFWFQLDCQSRKNNK